jgi:hypothetical protein
MRRIGRRHLEFLDELSQQLESSLRRMRRGFGSVAVFVVAVAVVIPRLVSSSLSSSSPS